jgi:hypothetical protein
MERRLHPSLQMRGHHRLRDPVADRGHGGFILPLLL